MKQTLRAAAGEGAQGAASPNRGLKDEQCMKKSNHSKSPKGGPKGPKPKRHRPAQKRSFQDLGQTSRGWGELMEEQRTAWRHRAADVRTRTRQRRSRPLRGQELYNKINSVLALLGRERRTDPLWVAKTPLRCNWRHRAALEGDCVAREVTPGLDHDLEVLGLWDRNRPSEDRE